MRLSEVERELVKLDERVNELVRNDEFLASFERRSIEQIRRVADVELGAGSTIRVTLQRDDGVSLSVFVSPDASVRQLRQAVEAAIEDYVHRQRASLSLPASTTASPPVATSAAAPKKDRPLISWKQFWRRHQLAAHDVRLDEPDRSIRDYNVTSGTTLTFVKRARPPTVRARARATTATSRQRI